MKIRPVILCGGAGTRLWPQSKNNLPKQFIDWGGWTLFGKTLERVKSSIFDYPIITTNSSGNTVSHPIAGWHIFNTLEFSLGDINGDNLINIQDIVLAVNLVLSSEYNNLADLNSDSTVDILDIVQLVNIILS